MSKISREDNKKRFKTGMYPTQQDFENVFDSYVHKDDTIDPSKIVSGEENIIDIINRKAEESHSHEIADVNNLSETLQQIQDDLDTAEDNIAGHETRIVTLEAAKTDYEAFKERVRAFLEEANASDTTIDRWHEIENFLQGITDTETLTGLLNDLKQEILAEIPEPQPQPSGNYLELVDDLDAYTDAPDGKIVKYVGQTNEKYTRGFDYERVVKVSPITENTQAVILYNGSGAIKNPDGTTAGGPYYCIGDFISNGDNVFTDYKGSYILVHGRTDVTVAQLENAEDSGENSVRHSYICSNVVSVKDFLKNATYSAVFDGVLDNTFIWQPIPSFNVIN